MAFEFPFFFGHHLSIPILDMYLYSFQASEQQQTYQPIAKRPKIEHGSSSNSERLLAQPGHANIGFSPSMYDFSPVQNHHLYSHLFIQSNVSPGSNVSTRSTTPGNKTIAHEFPIKKT